MNSCPCGSGRASAWLFDAKGIEVARCCVVCIDTVKAKYRPEIFTDPNYHTDEPVSEDEGPCWNDGP